MKLLKGSTPDIWALSFPYDPEVVARVKAIPGMRWDKGNRLWVGPTDAVAQLTKMPFVKPAPEAEDEDDIRTGYIESLGGPWGHLRAYQGEGVAFLLSANGAILADEMGLGKTVVALTAANQTGASTVIVCPNYVRNVWAGEIKKWGLSGDVWLPSGVTRKSPVPSTPPRWTIISYDILHAWVDTLTAHTVIFDEAHALCNAESQRTKACKILSSKSVNRWALTGTPLTNRIRDLYAIVDVIRPGSMGSFFQFGSRYCAAHQEAVTPTKVVWKFDGKSNVEELASRLKYFTIRRTKSDVGLQLPPKTRQTIWLDTGKKPKPISLGDNPNRSALRALLDKSADAKLPEAFALVLAHVEAGHKVVAFTHRRAVADGLVDQAREEGHTGFAIHGGISLLRRQKAIKEASEMTGGCLLACTIDSSSTGIDLSFCDVGCFLELTYEPHELLQAEARLHRFGQRKPTLIQYLLAKGSIEEMVAKVIVDRLDQFQSVVGAVDGADGMLSNAQDEDALLEELYASISGMASSTP